MTVTPPITSVFAAREWRRPAQDSADYFLVSTDPAWLHVGAVHRYLSEDSYWAKGTSKELVERSLRHCCAFGLYHVRIEHAAAESDTAVRKQIGLARAITDYSTFAYLSDVYVDAAYQRRGLGKWLVECVMAHPELQGLRRWMLVTRDAHTIYHPLGFGAPEKPDEILVWRPDRLQDQETDAAASGIDEAKAAGVEAAPRSPCAIPLPPGETAKETQAALAKAGVRPLGSIGEGPSRTGRIPSLD